MSKFSPMVAMPAGSFPRAVVFGASHRSFSRTTGLTLRRYGNASFGVGDISEIPFKKAKCRASMGAVRRSRIDGSRSVRRHFCQEGKRAKPPCLCQKATTLPARTSQVLRPVQRIDTSRLKHR